MKVWLLLLIFSGINPPDDAFVKAQQIVGRYVTEKACDEAKEAIAKGPIKNIHLACYMAEK